MIEKWDTHRITLKMVGLKGGMMNAPIATIADTLGLQIIDKQISDEEHKGEEFNAEEGFVGKIENFAALGKYLDGVATK